jgi:large subunit ribosomal protein L9
MDIILTTDVENLGEMGEVVKVSAGYGRNFLIPKGYALPATTGNRKSLNHVVSQVERRKERERQEAMGILGKIDNVSVTVSKQVGEADKLFGSVTNREIVDHLADLGFSIERRQVLMSRPLSELGIYKVPVKLASGVVAHIRVWVVAA